MFDERSGDILNHRGARAHRDTDQGRDVYLCFDSAVCDVRARTVGTRARVPRRPGSLVTRSRHDIRLAHSSCPHLIKIFSQSPPLLVLCSQWPLLCRTLLSRLFSLRSVHWSLFPVSLRIFLPCLSGIGIHYLSPEMELLSNAHMSI